MVCTSGTNPVVSSRPRACIPCHKLKVKCSASHTGLPCTRCSTSGRSASCELVPIPGRSAARLRARRQRLSETRGPQEEQVSPRQDASHASKASANLSDVAKSVEAVSDIDTQNSLPELFATGCSPPPLPTRTSPGIHDPSTELPAQGSDIVTEEDSQLETCLLMAQSVDRGSCQTQVGDSIQVREVFEYHGGDDSTTILGQLLSDRSPRRFVRILLRDPYDLERTSEKGRNDSAADFLGKAGAFLVPPRTTCDKLVHLYFERVFPYAPILDRLSFMRQFACRTHSPFLLQSILTSVAPYMTQQLLEECAYEDRATAQRSFFSRAQLLYDLGAEKSQLTLLQGSLVLTLSYFSFGLDKDCRFWLSNAVRIATQMGLHRKQIADQLGTATRKLFTRIFWVMYCRDVVMVMAGRINVRVLDDRYCDLPEVTQDDWEEESTQERCRYALSPITALQRSYLVHSSRLARICAQCIEIFRCPGSTPTRAACEDTERKIRQWRRALPPELHPETVEDWSSEKVWILNLRAMGFRLECVLYRNIRDLHEVGADDYGRRALQKQQNAMLELDAVIQRVMLHDLVGFCTFSMYDEFCHPKQPQEPWAKVSNRTTCASTAIAMHVEMALSPHCLGAQRELSRTIIHNGLTYLRASSQHWDSVRWTLRMLEAIVSQTGLSLPTLEYEEVDLAALNSRVRKEKGRSCAPTDSESSKVPESHSTDVTFTSQETDSVWSTWPTQSTSYGTEAGLSSETMRIVANSARGLDEIPVEELIGADSFQSWVHGLVPFQEGPIHSYMPHLV